MAHTRVSLDGGDGFALLSDDELTDTAIIYVHGFWGGPQTTWQDIVYYVDRLEGDPLARSDLFFCDYQAEDNFLVISASQLSKFVRSVYPMPSEELFSVSLRDLDWRFRGTEEIRIQIRTPTPYRRAVLVGHSLGAVVIRRLVADESFGLKPSDEIESESMLRAQVRLFAPAHLGFHPAALKRVLWSTPFIGPVLFAVATGGHRAFEDLGEGCHALDQLHRETNKAASLHPNLEALRPFVMWGRKEDVVVVGRFDCDPPDRTEADSPEKNHIEVCKVTEDYMRPPYFVANLSRKTSA